jgi:hypothetical protein
MRRFLTLVCLLGVAIPAGFTISGCTRNPGGNYCNGLGYGLKDTDPASITIGPETTGISLAFGQTSQISSPSATTCKGTAVSVKGYSYGTTNNQLVDVSPTGAICAGTWNRNSGGGIANYTICNFPNPLPSSGGLPYGVAYVTASAASITSNPVEVHVHPQVTSISLVATPTSGSAQQCVSQTQTAQLDAQACYLGANNTQELLCAPSTVSSANYACPAAAGATISTCSAALGTLSFSIGNSGLASINQDTNVITADYPGTTVVSASVAGGSSAAGFFSICPPASISITLANGSTSGTITKGVQQNLTTTITDTNGNSITGLSLDYESTDPVDISAGSGGGITTTFPAVAAIYAICQPNACNPAPINKIGLYGTGLPISSNPVTVTTPGTASDLLWFGSPGQSQYFAPIELLTGTLGSPVRMPYVPNSMLMDKSGTNLYFGSAHELMEYNTSSNSLSKEDANVPGVVLAVSPSNDYLLINDQARQLFYIYPVSGGSSTTFGGMGNAAAWTPDEKTLYITDNANLNSPADCSGTPLITGHSDKLYVYSLNTGWTTYSLPPSPLPAGAEPTCDTPPNVAGNLASAGPAINLGSYPPKQTPAITIPSVGAYLRGTPTVSHTWCPSGTIGGTLQFYPLADQVAAQSDVLAATTDGKHILGGSLSGTQINLADIGVSVPTGTKAQCPGAGSNTLSPLGTDGNAIGTVGSPIGTVAIDQVAASSVNQVAASPASNLAFITYSGSTPGASLPYYVPSTTGVGKVGYITLTGNAKITAPLAGAFTPDDQYFFVSTAGDNQIHYISVPTLTDTQQIAPNLPACTPVSGGGNDVGCTYSGSATIVPTTTIVVKPRATT